MPKSKTNPLNGKQIQVVVDNPIPQAPTKQELLQSMLHCASDDQENYPEAQWKNTPNHTVNGRIAAPPAMCKTLQLARNPTY